MVTAERRLSYGELDGQAGRLAHTLSALGVGPEVRVGLCLERSPELVISALAVLKAGGAYVALDPFHPAERLAYELADCRATILLTRRGPVADLAARLGIQCLFPHEIAADCPAPAMAERASPSEPAFFSDGLAYVIYTSGSTGLPKGVEIRHRSLLNLVRWHVRTFGLTADDRGTLLAGVGFDASVWETWPYLAAGASLHLVPEAIRTSAEALPGWLAAQEITVSFLPTPLAEAVLDQEWPTSGRPALRFLLTGGDRLHAPPPPSLPFVLVNDYGPTEATVVATSGPVAAGAASAAGERNGPAPSLGRSIANSRAYVLDGELQPVPLGVPGELLLGGDGLARGYLGLPALTAERFLPDPFAGRPGARRYRTGDLVRLLPGGELEFLGRIDHQVKIRGYRIELGEIETVLARHPAVRETVVLAVDDRLVAFCTVLPDSLPSPAPADLADFLRRALPDSMVPASFLLLPELPLSPSGKVDRQALARLRPAAEPEVEAALFLNPTEELLAHLWEEVLDRSGVGPDDNFFHLGGHSLLVTRVLSRIRQAFGVDLPVQALFESPTLRGLARVVTVARRQAEAIVLPPLRPGPPGSLSPLSFPQQRLWFIDRLAPDSSTYNIPTAFRLRGSLDSAALAASLDAVVCRHEMLRTRFVEVDGQPWQEILPPAPVPFPSIDLGGLPEARREAELARLGWEEAGQPFDLRRGPLLRARRIRLGGEEHALLLTLHHVAADGWSVGVLFAELSALYGAATLAPPAPLPALAVPLASPLAIQYADFAVWQRAWPPEVLAGQLDYWRRHLADLATLEVATDRPRPPVQTFRGDVETVTVPVALTAALRTLTHDRRVTLFMTLLAAWQALLHRLTGQTDIVVGSPTANRTHRETEGLIGFFVNLLALRADCGGDPSFGQLLEQVRSTALLAYDHADLPFERLVDELALGRDLSRQPLVQVMFALENALPTPPVLAGLTVSPLDSARAVAKFDLTLALFDRGDELAGSIEYSTDLFDRVTVKRLAGRFVHLLAAVAADPEARLSGAELLSTAERHQLVSEWNDTAAPFVPALLHQPFEASALRTPGALAAVCAGEEMTYGELELRSNRLAHLLRDRGLERGEPVGVWMERSLDMLVAVLGALKAGGFYVPLDAAWPAERVESILAAMGTRALIAGGSLLPAVEQMQWRLPALSDVVCLAVATPRLPPEAIDAESVRGLWDYVAERAVDRATAGGFVSAWTGLPFKEAEVDEYRDRVLALAGPWLQPSARILEIGSGAGLLFWEMASRVAHATGIDPSPLTQEKNRARAAREDLDNVDLWTGFAHELDTLLAGDAHFDLILLASTVQFFPGPHYLEQIVARALSRLAPGGALLIADVLDARRRDELQRRIAEHRGKPPAATPGRGRELYLDEDLFRDLGAALPEVGEVAILHRTEGFDNELGFRYDVLFIRAPEPLAGTVNRARGERRRHLWTAWHTARCSAERPRRTTAADDIAYVIYTSGSTGTPKGIVVQHRAAAHLVDWVDRTFGVGPADRVLFVTSLCFDLSVYDLFGVLAAGGTVHVATEEELGNPDRMVRLLRGGTITLWDSAPAALVQLAPLFPATPDPASRLRLVLLSGDWIPVTLPDRVRTAFPGARVVSLGGATEATVWSNWYPLGEVDPRWPSIPYGRPIDNARYLVLDAAFAPCPIGVPGDLYIGDMGDLGDSGGACLSVGYAHEPGLTAAGFLPDPFAAEPGGRLYRTGDRARFGADGNLEFLGRIDQQVKVRGFRIELGEIEVALARQPEVREAVVLAREDRPGDQRLVAYVVPAGRPAAPPGFLREALRQVLPEYMVPAAFVFLDALPVTANGKLDRKALPVPHLDEQVEANGSWAPPRTPTEELLAGLWREILGVERVGIHDSFFALGGHSLLATQLMARLREILGVEVPLRALFQRPTVADLAVEVEAIAGLSREAPAGVPQLRPIPRDGELPLSFSQLRQWFLVQLEPEATLYNLPLTLRLVGPLAVAPLERSLDEIVRRHESLRSTYSVVGGRPVQVIAPELALPLPRLDLGGLPADEREAESRRLIQAEGEHPFDLTRGPLLHASLLRLAAEEHFLLVTVHHIAFDGWSLGVFTHELAALYQAFHDGLPSPLAELAIQYVDYASWQRHWLAGEEAGRQIDYWRTTLAGATKMLHLATDRPRPAVQTFRGAFESVLFPAALAGPLRALGLAEGATLYMTLLAGFCALLQRYTRQDDLNLGTFVANRRQQAFEPLLGLFVNTLVLRANLAGEPSFRELLARVRETTLGAYEHQDIPFEMLLDALETERDLGRTPLFQVMFGLQNFAVPRIELPSLEIAPLNLYEGGRANFELALWAWEEGGVLQVMMQYNVDLFEPLTIRRMLYHLTDLLAEATGAPDRRVDELRLLTVGERHQVVHEWSSGPGDGAEILLVHEQLALQAARTPDATAVVQEDRVLTYAELDRRAGSLARSLQALGVGPETVVGISCPRSLEMILGLFGVLRAGGAYLPLDPSLPDERIAFLLADAGAGALLTSERLAGRRLDFPGPLVFLEQEREVFRPGADAGGISRVGAGAKAELLAYVLYTSGSTGRPKGVLIDQGSLASFARSAIEAFALRPGDRMLQFASLGFDTSVEEIYATLLAGATLVLRTETMHSSPALFLDTCRDWGITLLDLPTAYWHVLAAEISRSRAALPRAVRAIIVGGERALPERVRGWFETVGPYPPLFNTYGPTEATVASTGGIVSAPAAAAAGATVPIGRPTPNTRLFALDASLNPVPIGVAGELHITGRGLARGYSGRPDLTAWSFIPSPFGEPGSRVYRSGDLVRYLPDGTLDFVGRIDDQVKIRGFRVEPGEIATLLADHPAVREAAVLATTSAAGDWRLTAYFVAGGPPEPTPGELRDFLKIRLPAYMVPSDYLSLEAMPLTATGKLDRAALRAPDREGDDDDDGYVAPTTVSEELLADIWRALLDRERVSIYDNFFDLGGHSLLVPQLMSRIEEVFEVELPLRLLFEFPTVAQLALAVEGAFLAQIESLGDEDVAASGRVEAG